MNELFRKLSSGAKFKQSSTTRVQNLKPRLQGSHHVDQLLSKALDFFGDSPAVPVLEAESSGVSRESGRVALGKHRRGSELIIDTPEDEDDDDDDEEMKEEVGKEGVALFAGSAPVSTKKDSRTPRGKRRKKHSREAKELLRRQEANAFRNSHQIYVSGSDVPDPVENFDLLSSTYTLPSYLLKNVVSMGYAEPTPIQMQAIPLMLQRRELLAIAPTGSGKTAAFAFPILSHLKVPMRVGFRALVVSPTRELAQQTYQEFVRLSVGSGFKVHVLTKAKANANTFGPDSSQRFDILMTTPNRLVHMLSQEPPAIQLHNVEWLILDEADKLFEDGPSGFKDQVATIYRSCDHPDVKHALFSATLGCGIEEFARAHLDNSIRVIIGLPNTATLTVKQELLFVGQESGKLIAVREIISKGFTPPVLVFVQSIERAKELFHELVYDGLNVDVINSERTQAQRDNIIRSFRSGKIWILICTDVMSRGIDFKGVNLVLNYDFPPTAVSYIHRIGRTGRAGRPGRALTFFTEDDSVNLRSIANVMQNSGCEIPEWMLKLKKPSKNTRKKLSKKPVAREQVKTVSKYDLQCSAKRKAMVAGSKRRTNQL